MKIAVILTNSDGEELDRHELEALDEDDEEYDEDVISDQIDDVIENWPLRVGDTISIVRV